MGKSSGLKTYLRFPTTASAVLIGLCEGYTLVWDQAEFVHAKAVC